MSSGRFAICAKKISSFILATGMPSKEKPLRESRLEHDEVPLCLVNACKQSHENRRH